jgi:hypothetical protein
MVKSLININMIIYYNILFRLLFINTDIIIGNYCNIINVIYYNFINIYKVDDCLVKTNGSDKNIRNILFMQWIMFGL